MARRAMHHVIPQARNWPPPWMKSMSKPLTHRAFASALGHHLPMADPSVLLLLYYDAADAKAVLVQVPAAQIYGTNDDPTVGLNIDPTVPLKHMESLALKDYIKKYKGLHVFDAAWPDYTGSWNLSHRQEISHLLKMMKQKCVLAITVSDTGKDDKDKMEQDLLKEFKMSGRTPFSFLILNYKSHAGSQKMLFVLCLLD